MFYFHFSTKTQSLHEDADKSDGLYDGNMTGMHLYLTRA